MGKTGKMAKKEQRNINFFITSFTNAFQVKELI